MQIPGDEEYRILRKNVIKDLYDDEDGSWIDIDQIIGEII